MKVIFTKIIFFLTIISPLLLLSCSESNENLELTIQDKIELLEDGEWLLKGFEDNVMHTFADGERFTYYGQNSTFSEPAIPGTQEYTITGNMLTLDFNFGTIIDYELIFSCDNNIVDFFVDGELRTTLYKRSSNYEACLE